MDLRAPKPEEFLKSGPGVNPAPEGEDLVKTKTEDKMDEDDMMEARASIQDMNLNTHKW